MEFDYSKLNGRIVEVFGTQLNFSIAMGLSERSISLKLNNKVAWKNTEIAKAAKLLKIKHSEIPKYFFRILVHESWTKTCCKEIIKQGGEQMERIKDKQKKEPIKAPIKIDKESAQKSLINFRQSLKKIR